MSEFFLCIDTGGGFESPLARTYSQAGEILPESLQAKRSLLG